MTGGGMQDFVVITGFSGAGKSQAIATFEDAGYFCVDNLPPEMIRSLAELFGHEGSKVERAAVVEVLQHADQAVEVLAPACVGGHRRALDLAAAVPEEVRQRADHLRRKVVDAEVAGVLERGHRLRLARAAEARDHDEVLDHRTLFT